MREKRQRTGKRPPSSCRVRRDPTESATRKNRLFLQSKVLNTYRNDHDTKSDAVRHTPDSRNGMEDFSGHVQRDSEPGADGLHDGMDVLARKPARPDGTAGARLLHRLRGQHSRPAMSPSSDRVPGCSICKKSTCCPPFRNAGWDASCSSTRSPLSGNSLAAPARWS